MTGSNTNYPGQKSQSKVTYLIVAYSWSNTHCWQSYIRGLQDFWQWRRTKACWRWKYKQYKLLSFTLHAEKPALLPFPPPANTTITHPISSEANPRALYTSLIWRNSIACYKYATIIFMYHTVLFKVLTEHVPLACRKNQQTKTTTTHHLSFFLTTFLLLQQEETIHE